MEFLLPAMGKASVVLVSHLFLTISWSVSQKDLLNNLDTTSA